MTNTGFTVAADEVDGELLGRKVVAEVWSPFGDFGSAWHSKEACPETGTKWALSWGWR